jgi:hypothetical protein
MLQLDTLLVKSCRMVRNTLLDIRYGGPLCLNTRTWRKHGLFDGQNSDYAAMAQIFRGRISPSDVLVDIGCRKGRVINWWLSQGFRNQMIGIELDEDMARDTQRRLRRYKNVTIIAGDCLNNIPPQGTQFYLYNPFDAPIVQAFKDRMLETFNLQGNVTLIYSNCLHIDVFERDKAWRVEVFENNGLYRPPFPPYAVITPAQSVEAGGGSNEVRLQSRRSRPGD